MTRARWLTLLGLLLVAAGAAAVYAATREDGTQLPADRVGGQLADVPGAVDVRRLDDAPEGGSAYAGEVRNARGTRLRFGVVVDVDLTDAQLERILPGLTRAGGGENWTLASDANSDPRLAPQRWKMEAEVIAALHRLTPNTTYAP